MKYIYVILLGSLLFGSCNQEIQDNTPGFQGLVDTTFFRGNNNSAVVNSDGSVAIRGKNVIGEVQVVVSSLDKTVVTLGEGAESGNVASYLDNSGTLYTTNSDLASGEISLEFNDDNTISGELRFIALTESETDTITFSRGFIFKVPILNEFTQGDFPSQEEMSENTFSARINGLSFVPSTITTQVSNGILSISSSSGGEVISLTMPDDVIEGVYDISPGGTYSVFYVTPEGIFNAIEGTLTIISNDTGKGEISGSFIFNTPNNDFVITDGVFSVSY